MPTIGYIDSLYNETFTLLKYKDSHYSKELYPCNCRGLVTDKVRDILENKLDYKLSFLFYSPYFRNIDNYNTFLSIVNDIEQILGWSKTTIEIVNDRFDNKYIITKLPQEWFKISGLLSLYLLIAITCSKKKVKVNGLEEFHKYVHSNITDIKPYIKGRMSMITHTMLFNYWSYIVDKFMILINNYEELFNEPIEEYFPTRKNPLVQNGIYHDLAGIINYCYASTFSQKLNNKIHTIMIKEGIAKS